MLKVSVVLLTGWHWRGPSKCPWLCHLSDGVVLKRKIIPGNDKRSEDIGILWPVRLEIFKCHQAISLENNTVKENNIYSNQNRNPFSEGVVSSNNCTNQDTRFVEFCKLVEGGWSLVSFAVRYSMGAFEILKWGMWSNKLVYFRCNRMILLVDTGSLSWQSTLAMYFSRSMTTIVGPLWAGRKEISLLFWRI